jgi:hypothetical protein
MTEGCLVYVIPVCGTDQSLVGPIQADVEAIKPTRGSGAMGIQSALCLCGWTVTNRSASTRGLNVQYSAACCSAAETTPDHACVTYKSHKPYQSKEYSYSCLKHVATAPALPLNVPTCVS